MENKDINKSFFAKKSFRKVYFLLGLSVLGLIGVFILLNRITIIGEEIQTTKKESVNESEQANIAFLKSEIAHYEQQVEELSGLFATDSEVILFVTEIDRLKKEGVVESFSFVSDKPIKDKSGNFGFPIAITLRGSREQVDAALRNIQSLPFLLRGVQADLSFEVNEDGTEIAVLHYGGFLYVTEPGT